MMTKSIISLLLILFLFSPALLWAQSDPVGEQDSVRFGIVSTPPGGKAIIEVSLYNDEDLSGFTIPLMFDNQYFSCDSIVYTGTRLESEDFVSEMIDNDNGLILFGGVVMQGDPVPAGSGVIAKIVFSVSYTAPLNTVFEIDTTFVPPAGGLELTSTNADEIFPVFTPGSITITSENQAPVFEPIKKQYITEGDQLSFKVSAYDLERDEFKIYATRLPEGAEFDSEANILQWTPDYIGPNSSLGNPFEIVFSASDGISSGYLKVPVEVLNKNRLPELVMVETFEVDAGDLVEIMLAAEDADFENVNINVDNLPDGAVFDNQNPGLISWQSELEDSGSYIINVTAIDNSGGISSQNIDLTVNAVSFCDLEISNTQTLIGSLAEVEIIAENRVPVSGMQLLLSYDPTAMTLSSSTNIGTRIEGWEQYNVSYDDFNGLIWITANADLPTGDPVEDLSQGKGVVSKINFLMTSDAGYIGVNIPISFEFIDQIDYLDNTFIDSDGGVINQDQISYVNGSVFIKQYEGLIGDLNLNEVPFEIADVVYYTNYFVDPQEFPLEGEALLNSDVNQDGRTATVGDLIYLIRIVTGDAEPLTKPDVINYYSTAAVRIIEENQKINYYCDWESELGGALFRFVCSGDEPVVELTDRTSHLNPVTSFNEGIYTVLLCDIEGQIIKAGECPLFVIHDNNNSDIHLESVELADKYGNYIDSEVYYGSQIPDEYRLYQNYPNPFNPQTTIRFGLPQSEKISLKIYNILGQEVVTLIDDYLEAGMHEVVWDGNTGDGKPAASGVYFYKLVSSTVIETKKMIMLK